MLRAPLPCRMNRKNFVNVDAYQRDAALSEAAALCGQHLEVAGSGRNVRIDCPFGCAGDHAGKHEIAVDTENAAKQWKCHAYGCDMRGNLLKLMHGWLTGTLPQTEKLRGDEFTRIRDVIVGGNRAAQVTVAAETSPPLRENPKPIQKNTPLLKSEHEAARSLMQPPLWEKFITEISAMPPAASAYVRRHPCLTKEAMVKWHVGVMSKGAGDDKRGFSLRGHVVYPLLSESGEALCFVGRNVNYEKELEAFEAIRPEKRDPKKCPVKHRFPKGFQRGLEFFGQQRERLKEPGYREAIARNGIVVVEGFNDVIHLDNMGLPAVALCSNQITNEQVAKLNRWTTQLGTHVSLMLDCDEPGDSGAKEAAWKLLQAGVDVRLAWSRGMHGGAFEGRQAESVTSNELNMLLTPEA